MNKKIIVHDLMQSGYEYTLSEPTGKNFSPDFKPELSPAQMPELGVFGGKYMTDCRVVVPGPIYVTIDIPSSRSGASFHCA